MRLNEGRYGTMRDFEYIVDELIKQAVDKNLTGIAEAMVDVALNETPGYRGPSMLVILSHLDVSVHMTPKNIDINRLSEDMQKFFLIRKKIAFHLRGSFKGSAGGHYKFGTKFPSITMSLKRKDVVDRIKQFSQMCVQHGVVDLERDVTVSTDPMSIKRLKLIGGGLYRLVKSELVHELQHAYDDFRSDGDTFRDKPSREYYRKVSNVRGYSGSQASLKAYYGLPHEYWARFSQYLLLADRFLFFKDGIFREVSPRDMLNHLKKEFVKWDYLQDSDKKRLLKALINYQEELRNAQ